MECKDLQELLHREEYRHVLRFDSHDARRHAAGVLVNEG